MAIEIGGSALRAEVVDKVVKQVAAQTYKFKQALTISTTSAWTNTFYRESTTVLNPLNPNATTTAIKHIPRGAAFPTADVSWEKIQKWVEKYGLEKNIFWEDILTDDIDVQARTLFKIGQGVAKAVDDQIWTDITEGPVTVPTNVNSFIINEANGWNGTSGAVIDDLLYAKQLIEQDNYDTSNLIAFVSPRDFRSMMTYLAGKGAQFPSIGTDVASNGRVGKIVGIQIVVSNSVTASYAMVCVPRVCATWKEAVPLSTETTTDPYKSVRIRAVEMGRLELTDPNAVCTFSGTQGPY